VNKSVNNRRVLNAGTLPVVMIRLTGSVNADDHDLMVGQRTTRVIFFGGYWPPCEHFRVGPSDEAEQYRRGGGSSRERVAGDKRDGSAGRNGQP